MNPLDYIGGSIMDHQVQFWLGVMLLLLPLWYLKHNIFD